MKQAAYSSTLKMEPKCSPGSSVDFPGLHGVISKKTTLFMDTAVRTSDWTNIRFFSLNVNLKLDLRALFKNEFLMLAGWGELFSWSSSAVRCSVSQTAGNFESLLGRHGRSAHTRMIKLQLTNITFSSPKEHAIALLSVNRRQIIVKVATNSFFLSTNLKQNCWYRDVSRILRLLRTQLGSMDLYFLCMDLW
jgi:hypothetical protein